MLKILPKTPYAAFRYDGTNYHEINDYLKENTAYEAVMNHDSMTIAEKPEYADNEEESYYLPSHNRYLVVTGWHKIAVLSDKEFAKDYNVVDETMTY